MTSKLLPGEIYMMNDKQLLELFYAQPDKPDGFNMVKRLQQTYSDDFIDQMMLEHGGDGLKITYIELIHAAQH